MHDINNHKELSIMNRLAAILLSIVIIALLSCAGDTGYRPRAGDILFQDLDSPQSVAVKLATGSEYTHCGIVLEVDGEYLVYEAVQPVQVGSLDSWIARGVDSHFVALRLQDYTTVLTADALNAMRIEAERHIGKDYDLVFNWSDDKLYCSELVWKVYQRGAGLELTPPRPLESYDLSHPAVQRMLSARYGDSIPLDEPMVAPSDLFGSEKLDTVWVHSTQ
ncbi:MAG: YiiX family permuted papain-like enzyme [Candidatus Zixiibacteriota bacterium]|nr:MAG: YiiX family permuted papain-like enzyme [candidate division Zixibacteria bacterium]